MSFSPSLPGYESGEGGSSAAVSAPESHLIALEDPLESHMEERPLPEPRPQLRSLS